MTDEFEEIGRKVQRMQSALERIRGVGTVAGVRVVVDADGRLVSVSIPEEEIVLAAYHAALQDMQPQVDEATREVRSDTRMQEMSTFVRANAARTAAERSTDENGYRVTIFENI
ncbi:MULTISPECIES: YbaB/EbfC family nucleoid-associated protein [unclassified Nocardia]|uniref:YbaB/EbfC family nucleoid-associated protein n=1 Tax=unclassified Nocardia TaxID=2637762 RepID=UPI001CE41808|nr:MULTISPECIES: YbaB/EbfC family nucleoid-associated protein [unclassified Nocardia]